MSHSITLMSMVLVFVTVSALALPYAQEAPAADEEVAVAIDDTLIPLVLDEGDETVDGRHHYSGNRRPATAYYNRPSYNRPATTYNYRPAAAAYNYRPATTGAYYNSRPKKYGSAGHHTSSVHQSSNKYYGNSYGYQSHHGTFGGLGWREGQKPSAGADDAADVAPSAVEEDEPLVQDVAETADPGAVVFQQQ